VKFAIRNSSIKMEMMESLAAAKKGGFEGVELGVTQEEHMAQLQDAAERRKLKEEAERNGVAITSLSFGLLRRFKFTGDDRDLVRQGVEATGKVVDICKELGGVAILMPTFDWEKIDLDEGETERYITAIKECAPAAEAAEIYLALETSFSVELLQKIMREVASPWVKIYQDVANAIFYGHETVDMLRRLADDICLIHIKDMKDKKPCMLGEGDVNWPGTVEAIKAFGYDNWFVFETAAMGDPVKSQADNLRRFKQIMGEAG